MMLNRLLVILLAAAYPLCCCQLDWILAAQGAVCADEGHGHGCEPDSDEHQERDRHTCGCDQLQGDRLETTVRGERARKVTVGPFPHELNLRRTTVRRSVPETRPVPPRLLLALLCSRLI